MAEEDFVVNVWQDNLDSEFERLYEIVDEYNYVAMDTEFPGVVARPIGSFKNEQDYNYQVLKCNVDMLNLIQLGLTFFNKHGERRPGKCTWQFNFKFSLNEDIFAHDSIKLLEKAGLRFDEHESKGIDPTEFAELFTMSGLVLRPDIKWLSFHSGYDFGYLLKLLSAKSLPDDSADFFHVLAKFFPNIFDLKHIMRSCDTLVGGLNRLASDLDTPRQGAEHCAGSDSLLTGECFFRLRQKYFEDDIDEAKFCGVIHGIGRPTAKKK